MTIPANFATGQGYSAIKTVQASLGGATRTANYNASGFNIDIGAPNEGTASSLVVTVLDGRGFSTSWTTTVQVYPYSNPDVNYTVARRNNFEVDTELSVSSSWAPVTISGVNKNAITAVTYATKRSGTSTWGEETPVTFSTDGTKVIVPTTVIQLPNEYSWNFRLTIKDKFGSFTKEASIPAGKPIMFIDAVRESVGFGNLTGTGETRNLNGVIEIEPERYHNSGKTGIQMNNSDISGLNGLFFSNDKMDNDGEGLHFIKSGKEINSPENSRDYDRFYMRDNGIYVNSDSRPLMKVNDNGYQTTSSIYTYSQKIGNTANFKDAYIDYSRWGQLVIASIGFSLLKDEGWKLLAKPPSGFTPSIGGAVTLSSQSYRGATVGIYVNSNGFQIVPSIGAGNANGDAYHGTSVYFTDDNYPV